MHHKRSLRPILARSGLTAAVALLASRSTGHVVFAQTKGLPGDMNGLLRETLKEFKGKGGGTRDFAQGSIPNAEDAESVTAKAQKALGS